jgi:hypothetical protein
MFTLLRTRPQNPRHFIALCFLLAKDDPSFKDNNKLLKKVAEHHNVAIFQCAYGFFCANKKQELSMNFSDDLADLKKRIRMPMPKPQKEDLLPLDFPESMLKEWTW